MKKQPHIAVNTRFLLPGGLEGMGRFTHEILRRLVHNHPNVHFSFFFDRPFDEKYVYGENVTPYVLFPPARHPVLYYLWFEWAVAAKLNSLKPDVFFSPDGFLSLRSKVPQIPVFHDLAFLYYPHDNKWLINWYYHHFWPQYARKAAEIITVSEYTKQDIIEQLGVTGDKISVVYNACADFFHPIEESEKQTVRNKYTAGCRYFHFVGAIHPRKNIDNLIRAFDLFKEQTGSDFKLLIAGRKAWHSEKVFNTFQKSIHREDILFTGFVSEEELNKIYGASEGLCYVPYFEGFGIPLLEAMHTNTPIICSNVTSMPEVAGDAALLVDPFKPKKIAAAMEKLAGDPDLRQELINKGALRKPDFSWDASAGRLWDTLAKYVF